MFIAQILSKLMTFRIIKENIMEFITSNLLEIMGWAGFLIVGAVSYYLKSKTTITSVAAELIAKAEQEYSGVLKAGKLKMEYCISNLYDQYVPLVLRTIFTREILQEIIQSTFYAIEKYVEVTINNMGDSIEDKLEEMGE